MEEENVTKTTNKQMTQEERLELCARLDKELDEFIDSLPKKKYEDGWPEDQWEEEMEKHPFFMTKVPTPGQELHPLYEGLQALKYDPEYNEPEELAMSYKEDGNFNFKHKNYRLAIVAYTEGINAKCGNIELEASLYNNRSAAHYFLKNYRSSLRDCQLALKMKPNYIKVLTRAVNCCYNMELFDNGIELCDTILELEKDNNVIADLKKECIKKAKLKARNKRKLELESKKKDRDDIALLKTIMQRGYHVKGSLTLANLEPCFPQLIENRVFLDTSNALVWPLVFVYPEYKIMDYIQQVSENDTLHGQLCQVFETPPEWDEERKYIVDRLSIYYETPKKKIVRVNINSSLKDTLKSENYIIEGGTPSFIILVRDSAAEKRFLHEY